MQTQLRAIEALMVSVVDHLLTMWYDLNQLGKRISSEISNGATNSSVVTQYERLLHKWLVDHRPLMVQALRSRMEQEVLTGPKKLQRFLQQRCCFEESLGGPLRLQARQVVLQSIDLVLSSTLRRDSRSLAIPGLDVAAAITKILNEPWKWGSAEGERTALVLSLIHI